MITTNEDTTRYYVKITPGRLKQFLAHAKFIQVDGNVKDGGESQRLAAAERKGQHWGSNDNIDHSKDSLEQLKELVIEKFKNKITQLGQYCNADGTLAKTIVVFGHREGFNSYCLYENGSFFRPNQ